MPVGSAYRPWGSTARRRSSLLVREREGRRAGRHYVELRDQRRAALMILPEQVLQIVIGYDVAAPVFFESGGRPGQDLRRTDDVRIHHQARKLLLGLLRPELEPVFVRRVVERCVARPRQPEVLGPQP